MPSDLHLTGLISEHGHQGLTHWLLFLFEVKGRLTLLPLAHSEGRFQFLPCDGAYAAGAGDAKAGAAGGALNLVQSSTLNHRCEITSGMREVKCRALLQIFFVKPRHKV